MAVTQAHVDALNEAIARGVRQVTIGQETVTYNTTESLIKARDDMVTQLAKATPAAKRPRVKKLVYMGRGYTE